MAVKFFACMFVVVYVVHYMHLVQFDIHKQLTK